MSPVCSVLRRLLIVFVFSRLALHSKRTSQLPLRRLSSSNPSSSSNSNNNSSKHRSSSEKGTTRVSDLTQRVFPPSDKRPCVLVRIVFCLLLFSSCTAPWRRLSVSATSSSLSLSGMSQAATSCRRCEYSTRIKHATLLLGVLLPLFPLRTAGCPYILSRFLLFSAISSMVVVVV